MVTAFTCLGARMKVFLGSHLNSARVPVCGGSLRVTVGGVELGEGVPFSEDRCAWMTS